MIIKAKPFGPKMMLFIWRVLAILFKWRFNKMVLNDVPILQGHSYILACNHFSFWDGFWVSHICLNSFYKQNPQLKTVYIMVLEEQIVKNKWLTRLGCFSVAPGSESLTASMDYIAEILDEPGNVLLIYPQGKLESNHVRDIRVQPGITGIIKRVTGNCQLLWSSNFIDYFESLKPSVYFNMLDCGSAKDFDYRDFALKINDHHKAAMKKQFRFTKN
ncbi:MAG: lysophospholipid acyltransferase family protein [Pedobacter sp.]|nr:lysophospholipid acyltransferase family protein [Pedobacter sp.]MDQ8053516.1 lysophospholipid acyltransferase family protein [Pedobacter sp.]